MSGQRKIKKGATFDEESILSIKSSFDPTDKRVRVPSIKL
jgi:hypothetical protein